MSTELFTWLTTYIIIVLCELGDKTQLAVLLFTSRNPGKRWLIFFASAIALTLCVAVEVTVGLTLAKYIGPHIINRAAGVVFLLLGLTTLYKTLHISEKLNLFGQNKRYADEAR